MQEQRNRSRNYSSMLAQDATETAPLFRSISDNQRQDTNGSVE